MDFVANPEARSPLPGSLYASNSGSFERGEALSGRHNADVVIIGAGMTGLSTALALRDHGVDVIVLEANEPGWGASGRNGGQINPGLKHDPDEIVKHFGRVQGDRMIEFSYSAADAVFDIVSRYDIECELVRGGGYRAAVDKRGARAVEGLYEQCAARGMPVELHDSARMAEATGTNRYTKGFFDRRAGQLNPLKYLRGLAQATRSAGAKLFCDSSVQNVRKFGSKWLVATADGEVVAERILFATNGYTGPLIPGLRRTVLPIFSSIVASAPLPEEVAQNILPGKEVLYEAVRMSVYYRIDEQRRLIFGGRGPMNAASGADNFRTLSAFAEKFWPAVKSAGWEYGWNGRIALTADEYPHIHDLGDGRLVCLGYCGRGIAVATAIGTQLAARLEDNKTEIDLPVVPVTPISFQPFWRIGAVPAMAFKRVQDAIDRLQ